MEKAVIYARYSSHNQTEQSIEGQLAAGHKYASEHGYSVVKEYCDRAKTGTNDNREAFQNMLKDCAKHRFSVIIVWKVDRFGRNREEITFNKYRAKKHGVRVEYVAENIAEGPEGVILESVLEGMAEYYSLQLSQNVRRGLLESAKKHQAIGGHVPLGYKISSDKTYEIDPDTADTVRVIFQKYVEGYTVSQLIKYLDKNGYRNRKGEKFTKNSIPGILANERYIGTYIYKNIIRDEDAIPAIISKELFAKAREKAEKNRKAPSQAWSYSDYLLTGKICCGYCGSPIIGKSGYGKLGTKYHYYVCFNHVKNKTCDKKAIRQEQLEEIVLNEVLGILRDENIREQLVDLIWDYYERTDTDRAEIEQLTRQISAIKQSISNLVKSVEDGMPYNMVKDRIEQLGKEREAAEICLAEKELSIGFKLTKNMIRTFLGRVTDTECQKKLIEVFVNQIYLVDDKVTIGLNYSENMQQFTFEDMKKASSVRTYSLDQGVTRSMRTRVYKNILIIEKIKGAE